jgi:hypothetical protein
MVGHVVQGRPVDRTEVLIHAIGSGYQVGQVGGNAVVTSCCDVVLVEPIGRTQEIADGILKFFHEYGFMRRQTCTIAITSIVKAVGRFYMPHKCPSKVDAHYQV